MSDSKPFAAKYAGKCVDCEALFEPGTMIIQVQEGYGVMEGYKGYKHAVPADCVTLEDVAARTKFQGTSLDEMGY